jgi:hypothetical protein
MVSLIDIVPQTRRVQINGGEVELRGLGLRQVAGLLVRFPELRKAFVEGAPAFDVEELLVLAPDAIGSLIAEAAGQPEAADNIADALALDDLAECLLAVRDLTMPNGPAPFLDRLTRLLGDGAAAVPNGRDQDMSTPPLPSN